MRNGSGMLFCLSFVALPVITFGLGGMTVEILEDGSLKVAALSKKDAREMIRAIGGYPVLEEYGGQPPSDVAALEDMIMKVSAFVEQTSVIKELDLKPVFAYEEGAIAFDARVMLEGDTAG